MNDIGPQLSAARRRRGLTLRDVEERSKIVALQHNYPGSDISRSWLNRVERGECSLSVQKLSVLAKIYELSVDKILGLDNSSTNRATVDKGEGKQPVTPSNLAEHDGLWWFHSLLEDSIPDSTGLCHVQEGILPNHFRCGIIGKHDKSM